MLDELIILPGRGKAPIEADIGDYLVYQLKDSPGCIAAKLKEPLLSIEFEDFENALIYAKGLALANGQHVWVPCDRNDNWSMYKPIEIDIESLAGFLRKVHQE